MTDSSCPFCNVEKTRVVEKNEFVVVLLDGYPVTNGHALIVPRRHVASPQDLSQVESALSFDAARRYCSKARRDDPSILGFNIGYNDGEAAGQTVFHAHLHVIPRRQGDVEKPRGGIRNIIPGKGSW